MHRKVMDYYICMYMYIDVRTYAYKLRSARSGPISYVTARTMTYLLLASLASLVGAVTP